jgi:predicted PurR-regulated permease PerM
MAESTGADAVDRRRVERRINARLSEVTVPELRRMVVTSVLFVIVLVLFLWMVRTVIIAGFLGIVVAIFLRRVYLRLQGAMPQRIAAFAALALFIVPILALTTYSYLEVADKTAYIEANQVEISAKIDTAVHRLPFMDNVSTGATVRGLVRRASGAGAEIIRTIRGAMKSLAVATTIFLFTVFYVMVEWEAIIIYVRSKVPPRYSKLGTALQTNVRGVLYGTVYSTFVTQGVKSLIILLMNLAFQVPLAGVLAILSFVIGFFPIVGSWSVYVPVAAWLAIFRDAPGQGLAMLAIGFGVNTVYISTYLRPKIAAERSKVLNFYWMLVGLVTGVYTFGLVGIVLGPILIGLLKAILDTITETQDWQFVDANGDALEANASDR